MVYKVALALLAAFYAFGEVKQKFYDKYYTDELLHEYDFIVVGAGTGGSVVANRLSENRMYKVLLIEAGRSGRGDPNIEIPFFGPRLFGGEKDWNYFTVNQSYSENRRIFYSRAKVAGGCSSHNFAVFQRGHPEDFEAWEEAGATGWGYEEVEEFYKRVEGSMDEKIPRNIGREGALKLTQRYMKSFYDFIEKTTRQLGHGMLGSAGRRSWISIPITIIYNATRQYAANTYLWPAYELGNLHFSFNSLVEKVLLSPNPDGRGYRATGVQFQRDGKVHEVRASKEVIVSGGSINSAQILMLSGIGPREHLRNMNIDTKVELAGVGSNYQDHSNTVVYFYGKDFPNDITTTAKSAVKSFPDYLLKKESDLGLTPAATSATVSFLSNLTRLKNAPYIQLHFSALSDKIPTFWPPNTHAAGRVISRAQNGLFAHFAIVFTTLQPRSRGSIRLQSNDPKQNPLIDPNFLSHPDDVREIIEGFRRIEEYENSPEFKKLGIKSMQYPDCSQFNFTIPRSEEYYRCVIKKSTSFFAHCSGSNKMGRADDPMAVLDPRLKVYGVENLRVADASVMPFIVTASTQATCYMIGEKAAQMIKDDWNM